MDMKLIREWLIANGKTPEELDQIVEPAVIRDIGQGLLLSLQNDDDIGLMLVQMMIRMEEMDSRIKTLEDQVAAFQEGGIA